jgi:hypothetical protein
MLERHDAQDGRNEASLNPDHPRVITIGRMVDREVPITGAASMSISDVPDEIHQWLDGDISERVARRVDNRNADLWARISEETGRRRRMQTPSQFSERVMAVLPSKAPSRLEMLARPFKITPATAVAVGAGLVAAGMFAGRIFLG